MLFKAPVLRRYFSTSAGRLVAPESPRFIEVPKVKLPRAPRTRPKGILPVPRKIFPKNNPAKGTPEFISAAARTPQNKKLKSLKTAKLPKELTAYRRWQANMAGRRRTNLREGLTQLKTRKEREEKRQAERMQERQKNRENLLNQKQAEDVALTLPSVLSTLRLEGSRKLADPRREERLAEMRERTEGLAKARFEERKQLLHQLYMQASSFILTEAQLDRAIDQQFNAGDDHIDIMTVPPTARDMLQRKENDNLKSPEGLGPVVLDVGGALTGGKIPETRNILNSRNVYGV